MGRNCVVHSGDALNLNDTDAQSAEFLTNCLTEPGARLRLTFPAPETSMDPIHHPDAPAHDAPAASHEAAAPEAVVEAPEVSMPEAAPHEPAAPAELHASTQVAEPNGVPDLSQISQLSGGNPIVTVILALVLVGGGTAGWKFWQKKSEQNHELKMQELEVQKEMAGLNGAQPPPCQAASAKTQMEIDAIRSDLRANADAHKKLQEQIDELAQKLAKFEKKAATMLSGDFDAEDVEDRLKKIEKALKADTAAKKAKKA
jgi:hypothetical protein